jgi:O-acetyl-ADP-ribose deacetylase (regulator of RNase III)
VIRLVERALADLPVDAVVRTADDYLRPIGSSSEALDRAAGERFADQRRVQAALEVGSAVITGGGELAAEFVLHIVIQGEDRRASRETIRKALTSAWHRAEGWQLTTVAAALTGLGGNALSLEEAAVALVESFRDRAASSGFPAELQIVIDDAGQRGAVEPFLRADPP